MNRAQLEKLVARLSQAERLELLAILAQALRAGEGATRTGLRGMDAPGTGLCDEVDTEAAELDDD